MAEVIHDGVEVYLLNDLQAECFVALLALLLEVPLDDIGDPELEAQLLAGPVDPHPGKAIDVHLGKCFGDRPTREG